VRRLSLFCVFAALLSVVYLAPAEVAPSAASASTAPATNDPAAYSGIQGVDVASYQHPGGAAIDWNAVAAGGYSFAFIKATEATNYTNPYFIRDWRGAGAAGMWRGAYHFARPALPLSTAVDQADWFINSTGLMQGAVDLPGVLDLETTGGLGPADLTAWAEAFLAEVQRLTGRAPILYTGYFFWRDTMGAPVSLARYRLWLPSWTTASSPSFIPSAWKAGWTFWQWSSTGRVPGISGNVDLNRFCCDGAALASLGGPLPVDPIGANESVVPYGPGAARVTGWAIDPDVVDPIDVHVYVDGVSAAAVTANGPRPDIGASHPGYGNNHGFTATVSTGGGTHQVCAYGINAPGTPGFNPQLGCRQVTVPFGDPSGNLEAVVPGSGSATVSGWALDPDTTAPINVHVYVDGTGVATTANGLRPDVGDAYPGFGDSHGFSVTVALPVGLHQVCAYAIDAPGTPGGNVLMGCRTVSADGFPVGALDSVVVQSGSVRIAGWALDPDTAGPVSVSVDLDGRTVASATAAGYRPDVAAAFPGLGGAHGFTALFVAPTGLHQVCFRAVNVPGTPGGTPTLGCRSVTVP